MDRAAQLFDALVLPAGEDPVVQGDRVVLAWLDYLEALTTAGPLALLVDVVAVASGHRQGQPSW